MNSKNTNNIWKPFAGFHYMHSPSTLKIRVLLRPHWGQQTCYCCLFRPFSADHVGEQTHKKNKTFKHWCGSGNSVQQQCCLEASLCIMNFSLYPFLSLCATHGHPAGSPSLMGWSYSGHRHANPSQMFSRVIKTYRHSLHTGSNTF